MRTTLYRVQGITTLRQAVRAKYLRSTDFKTAVTRVAGRDALLIHGSMKTPRAAWASRLSTISDVEVAVGNTTAAALLLIRDTDNGAWAVTYGMGFHLVDPTKIDVGFGMRVATRTARPEEIQSLTRMELDHRARTDRSSIPAGEALRGFGIRDYGEIVTRISSAAVITGLTVGDEPIRIRGADAISLPLGKTPSTLLRDLDAISANLQREPQPQLQVLEQFIRLKNSALTEQLDSRLREALAGETEDRLALGWPHERINENGTPSSFRLSGAGRGRSGTFDDLPTLDDLLTAIVGKRPDDPLSAAKSVKVQLFRDSDGEEPISSAIPVINWLFFEVELDGKRYCLFDSRWYAMDTDYAERLEGHVREIFSRNPPCVLPDWDLEQFSSESAYNTHVATALQGIMLDRLLLRTPQHPRGFEACDVITPEGRLIHIKHIPRSSAASHLIGQALVATDALRHDNEARQQLREVVSREGGDPAWVPNRLHSVVLGMARRRVVTAQDLFSFTQVTLTKLDLSLAASGVELTVASIRRDTF